MNPDSTSTMCTSQCDVLQCPTAAAQFVTRLSRVRLGHLDLTVEPCVAVAPFERSTGCGANETACEITDPVSSAASIVVCFCSNRGTPADGAAPGR